MITSQLIAREVYAMLRTLLLTACLALAYAALRLSTGVIASLAEEQE